MNLVFICDSVHACSYCTVDGATNETKVEEKNFILSSENLSCRGKVIKYQTDKTYLFDPHTTKIISIPDIYTFVVIDEQLCKIVGPHVKNLRERKILVVTENRKESRLCYLLSTESKQTNPNKGNESRSTESICKHCQYIYDSMPPPISNQHNFHHCNDDDITHVLHASHQLGLYRPGTTNIRDNPKDDKTQLWEVLHQAGTIVNATFTIKKTTLIQSKEYTLISHSGGLACCRPRIIIHSESKPLKEIDETKWNNYLYEKILKTCPADNDTISIELRKETIDLKLLTIDTTIREYQTRANQLLNRKETDVNSKEKIVDALTFTKTLQNEVLTNKKIIKDIMLGEMAIKHPQPFIQIAPEHMHNATIQAMKESQIKEKQNLSIINPSDSNAFRFDQLTSLPLSSKHGESESKTPETSEMQFINEHTKELEALITCGTHLFTILEPLTIKQDDSELE
nr:hypothetical protein [Endozoicomonas sp.]